MARVVFVLRKAHFSYHRSTIEALIAHGAEVRIFVNDLGHADGTAESVAFRGWTQAHPGIVWGDQPLRRDIWRKPLMFFRELRSFNNYCNRSDDFTFYRNRWSHYMKLPEPVRQWVVSPTGRTIAGSTLVRKLASAVERLAPSSSAIKHWLRKERPSVLVVSPANLRHSEDVEVLKAAKALGIKTAVPVVSWDNTSNKGLFHIHPNLMLAWNDAHQDELIKLHHVSPRRIRITGSPFFDKWFGIAEPPAPRQPFLTRVGLEPSRPFVLYLGSSANVAKDETWFIGELKQAFEQHADPRLQAVQILFRPHPANWRIGLPLIDAGIAMWPREGILPDDSESFSDFRNSLEHCVCVVGINTSGMLDAMIYGKPIISPLIDQYQLTQSKTAHFSRMLDMNAIETTTTAAETAGKVLELLDGRDPRADNRRAFVSRFVRPCPVSAGETQAKQILSLV
jgi:hypothetical protein